MSSVTHHDHDVLNRLCKVRTVFYALMHTTREMAYPAPTKGFSWSGPDTATLF